MEDNSSRLFTPLPFLLGPNFFKYNIRKVDRAVTRKIEVFDSYAQSAIEKHVLKLRNEAKTGSKSH